MKEGTTENTADKGKPVVPSMTTESTLSKRISRSDKSTESYYNSGVLYLSLGAERMLKPVHDSLDRAIIAAEITVTDIVRVTTDKTGVALKFKDAETASKYEDVVVKFDGNQR